MPEDDLVRARLLEVAAYFASAARGNVDEASGYGPYRLLEGVIRVVRVLDDLKLSDEELNSLARDLEGSAMKVIRDRDLARETADKALEILARELSG